MGWEKRGNHQYYYRKRRIGRRVMSEYIGAGEFGYFAEKQNRERKIKCDLEKATASRQQREVRKVRQVDQQIGEYEQLIQAIVGTAFLLNGFHTHQRQWRKRKWQTKPH